VISRQGLRELIERIVMPGRVGVMARERSGNGQKEGVSMIENNRVQIERQIKKMNALIMEIVKLENAIQGSVSVLNAMAATSTPSRKSKIDRLLSQVQSSAGNNKGKTYQQKLDTHRRNEDRAEQAYQSALTVLQDSLSQDITALNTEVQECTRRLAGLKSEIEQLSSPQKSSTIISSRIETIHTSGFSIN
jgi:chromosome segregation ATPase